MVANVVFLIALASTFYSDKKMYESRIPPKPSFSELPTEKTKETTQLTQTDKELGFEPITRKTPTFEDIRSGAIQQETPAAKQLRIDQELRDELKWVYASRKAREQIRDEAIELTVTFFVVTTVAWGIYWLYPILAPKIWMFCRKYLFPRIRQFCRKYLFPRYDIVSLWFGVCLLLCVAFGTQEAFYFSIFVVAGVLGTIYTYRTTK